MPGPAEIAADKNPEVCGATVRDFPIKGNDNRIQDVVFWLETGAAELSPPPAASNLVVVAEKYMFEPRVQASTAGSSVKLLSKDLATHNPHCWTEDDKTVFNLALVDPSVTLSRRLKEPAIYRIECDTHRWMRAHILLFKHSRFGVSNEHGEGAIKGIVDGLYQLHWWHEVLGHNSEAIEIKGTVQTIEKLLRMEDTRKPNLKMPTLAPWP